MLDKSQILVKASVDALAKPLTCIINQSTNQSINQSLTTGIFPNKLNIANIIPIFKKDDKHDFNNYRPISLLLSISKVFEKMYTQIFQYFTINKLLYVNEYGLRTEYKRN